MRCTRASPWQTGQTVRFLPRAAAARAGDVELHAAALLRDLALAVTLGTLARLLDVALAVTVAADLQARNAQLQLGAADRLPERRRSPGIRGRCQVRPVAPLRRVHRHRRRCWRRCRGNHRRAARRPAAPAPSEKSLKSKPLKSKGTSCVWVCELPPAPAPGPAPPNPPAPKPHRAHKPRLPPDRCCPSRSRAGRRSCASWDR